MAKGFSKYLVIVLIFYHNTMKINVGSMNKVKVDAVNSSLLLYSEIFPSPEVRGIEVRVEEFGHPIGIDSIFSGATDRAKGAFDNCEYSVGIESGIFPVKSCRSGYMEITGCVIFDGQDSCYGLSPAFEWPTKVTEFILSGRGDASLAFKELGYTANQKLGASSGGIIAELTNFRVTREEHIRQAIIMAMIRLERKDLE